MALPPLFSPSSASPWAGSGPGRDGQGGVAGSVQTLLGCAMLRGRREERRAPSGGGGGEGCRVETSLRQELYPGSASRTMDRGSTCY